MDKLDRIYEGKAKIIYGTDDPSFVIQYFKDDATAFDAKKKGTILDKGIYNNKISAVIFGQLEEEGIKTHFVRLLNDRQMLVRRLTILPLEVVVRNRIAGSLARKLGMEEGGELLVPVLEFFYKNDALHDPFINESHIKAFGFATEEELTHIKRIALDVNKILLRFFDKLGIILVDFKLEFGKSSDGNIYLADEITPDSCRLWDKKTLKKLDKDRFRWDLGEVEEAYQEIFRRVCPDG